MEPVEQGPFRETSKSGYVSPFKVKWFPPDASDRIVIKCLSGRSTGVGGLEVDEYSDFGVFDHDGHQVASFRDSYFENAGGRQDGTIREVLVLESDRLVVVRYNDRTEGQHPFAAGD